MYLTRDGNPTNSRLIGRVFSRLAMQKCSLAFNLL